jgi:hypothetical protein
MKSILSAILIFTILLFSSAAMAAMNWTVSASLDSRVVFENDTALYRVKLSAVSDGSNPDEFNLSSYLSVSEMAQIAGGLLYMVETDPGVAPDAAWAVSFDSDLGASILDLSGLNTTATEVNKASTDLGINPYIMDLQIDFADIGSDGDSVDVFFYIVK